MFAPLPPELVDSACGATPSFICRQVLERTESEQWAQFADVVFAKPLKILLVVVVAWLVNRLARRAIASFAASIAGDQQAGNRLKRRLRRTSLGTRLPASVLATTQLDLRAHARAETLGYVLRSVATFVIWVIALLTILGEVGIDLGPLVAGAGIVGVALGFGAQSLVRDFLAGIFILVEDQYGVGDVVDAGAATGTIEAVSLRTTRLRDVAGTMWHIPNGQIARVGNMSQQWARALLDLEISLGSDLDEAQAVIKRTADALWNDRDWTSRILEEPEVWGVEAFGPNGVTIRLVVKTLPAAQWGVLRELRQRLKVALDEAGIDLSTPQRAVWVRRDPGSSVESDSGADPADDFNP